MTDMDSDSDDDSSSSSHDDDDAMAVQEEEVLEQQQPVVQVVADETELVVTQEESDEPQPQPPQPQQPQQQQQQQQPQPPERAVLSKSWSRARTHGPLYTGGSVQYSPPLDCLWTPANGNVAAVDGATGRVRATVRAAPTAANSGDDDDGGDDDDSLDADAIVAFAVNAAATTVLTVSRNQLLRQYAIIHHHETAAVTNDTTATTTTATAKETARRHRAIRSIAPTKLWGKAGHALPVTAVRFHGSGAFAATGSVDGGCRVWDARGGYLTHVFRSSTAATAAAAAAAQSSTMAAVTCLQWFPDGRELHVAVGRGDGSLALHDLRAASDRGRKDHKSNHQKDAAAAPPLVLHDHVSAVTCVEWDTQQKLMITAGRDAVLNLWKYSYDNEEEDGDDAEFNNNNNNNKKKRKSKSRTITSQSASNNLPTYRRLHTLPIYEQVEGMVLLSSFLQDATMVATAGTKGQIRLWNVVQVNDGNSASEMSSSSSSLRLALHREQSDGVFGEARGGYTQLVRLSADDELGDGDGQLLAAADAEHNLTFLSAPALTVRRTVVGHHDEILDLKVLPQLQQDSTTSNTNSTNQQQPQPQRQQQIVVATNSPIVRVLDVATGSCAHVLDQHTATVLCVDVSPNGRWIATCGKDQQMRLWHHRNDTNAWKCAAVAAGHTEAVGATALSRQPGRYAVHGAAARHGGGAFCVTVSRDRTLKRWNLPDVSDDADDGDNNNAEQEPQSLQAFVSTKAHDKDINIVAVAPNDSLLATGSQDKTVKLWKANTLQLVATLKGHKRGVWDCQFSPHDRVLATASGDQTIKLWTLGGGGSSTRYSCQRTFQGHLASVLRVRFLRGGLQLVSSGADGLVKLWTVRTNECESTLEDAAHHDKVWALDLDPHTGKRMITGGADAQIIVWDDTTQEVDDAKRAEEEEAIRVEQRLANHLRHKEYAEALEISLERDKPHQTLKVLNAILEEDLQPQKRVSSSGSGSSAAPSPTLRRHAAQWSPERLVRVLRYCRDWNTRARNSHVALQTVQAIVSVVPVHTLAAMEGVPEVLAGIIPYAERHFERLDRLHAGSYLLDFALSSMGVVLEENASDVDDENDFAKWESNAKLVLPPKRRDGRVDVGGNIVVGASLNDVLMEEESSDDDDSDEVLTIGSDSEED